MTEQMLKACDLFPRTTRGPSNREYLVGYLGGVKVLIFRQHNPVEDGPTHTLFLAPRPPRQDKPAVTGQEPAIGSKQARDARVNELAANFDARGPDDELPF